MAGTQSVVWFRATRTPRFTFTRRIQRPHVPSPCRNEPRDKPTSDSAVKPACTCPPSKAPLTPMTDPTTRPMPECLAPTRAEATDWLAGVRGRPARTGATVLAERPARSRRARPLRAGQRTIRTEDAGAEQDRPGICSGADIAPQPATPKAEKEREEALWAKVARLARSSAWEAAGALRSAA